MLARDPLLEVENLTVRFATRDGPVEAVCGVSLAVARGETLAIVGESGSGKSQIMNAVMGLLASNGTAAGRVRFGNQEILGLPHAELNRIRGARIGMIFQEPMTSLDPLYRIGTQMALPLRRHGGLDGRAARQRSLDLLAEVGIPEPEQKIDAYPHELSGGQRQRVMIAMAIANEPELLIADEPTTALDVTVQARILDLLRALQRRRGMAMVLISHDLNVVRRVSDRVAVMHRGRVVEEAPVATLFAAPREDYTRTLLAAEPEGRKAPPPASSPTMVEARALSVRFPRRGRLFGPRPAPLVAVDGVSLRLREGGTLGIVGESGSGKSTLGRALLGLIAAEGTVLFRGAPLPVGQGAALRPLRRQMQVVFQDPFGSLSPRLTVGEIVSEGLLVHEPGLSRGERDRRAAAALAEVQLDPAFRNRYPHEFSGGQRQRIAIARAMILKPRLVLLDEPTSALDRTVQKAIVALLRDLQTAHGLTYLFISHDLAVVRALADHVLVMQDGRIVEEGPAETLFAAPRSAYTRELLAAAFTAPSSPAPATVA